MRSSRSSSAGTACGTWTTRSATCIGSRSTATSAALGEPHLRCDVPSARRPGRTSSAAEAKDAIDRGLAHLAPRQRAALVLTELLGFTSEEAASLLGIRAVTVRSLASRGRIVLKEALGGSRE